MMNSSDNNDNNDLSRNPPSSDAPAASVVGTDETAAAESATTAAPIRTHTTTIHLSGAHRLVLRNNNHSAAGVNPLSSSGATTNPVLQPRVFVIPAPPSPPVSSSSNSNNNNNNDNHLPSRRNSINNRTRRGGTTITLHHHHHHHPPPSVLLSPTNTTTTANTSATLPRTVLDPRFASIPVFEWQSQPLPDAQQNLVSPPPTPTIRTQSISRSGNINNSSSNDVVVEDVKDSSAEEHDDEQQQHLLDRAKCGICHDWIDACPVGCGHCTQRYCPTCLQTVLQPPQTTDATNHHRQPKKCPTCRNPFESVVPDPELATQLDRITLACRYVHCPERTIPILQYQTHEREDCSWVQVACRYAPMGCTFTGPRKRLIHEHASSCPYSQISGLLEHVRTMDGQYRQALDISTQRIQELTQAVQFLERQVIAFGSTLQQQQQQQAPPPQQQEQQQPQTNHRAPPFYYQPRHPYNPIDILYFAVTALSTTQSLLQQSTPTTTIAGTTTTTTTTTQSSPLLHSFHRIMFDTNGRAHVFNALAMVPTVLLATKYGIRTILWFDRVWTTTTVTESSTANQDDHQQPEDHSDCWFPALEYFLIFLGSVAFLMCMFGTPGSPRSWVAPAVRMGRHIVIEPPPQVFLYGTGLLGDGLFGYVLGRVHHPSTAIISWISWTFVSILIPMMILGTSLAATNKERNHPRTIVVGRQLYSSCRAAQPLLHALCIGFLAAWTRLHYSSNMVVLDAMALYSVLILPSLSEGWKTIDVLMGVTELPNFQLYAQGYLYLRSAVLLRDFRERNDLDCVRESIQAFLLLFAMIIWLKLLFMVSGKWCDWNYQWATTIGNASAPRIASYLGIVVLWGWILMLAVLVVIL